MNWLNRSIYKETQIVSNIGHAVLDVAGLIPGIGETADLTNAIWYIKSGQYLNAAFSLVSMIPVIGDIIGKGGRIGTWIAQKAPKGSAAAVKYGPKIRQVKNLIKQNTPLINQILNRAQQNKYLAPYVNNMRNAITEFSNQPDPNAQAEQVNQNQPILT